MIKSLEPPPVASLPRILIYNRSHRLSPSSRPLPAPYIDFPSLSPRPSSPDVNHDQKLTSSERSVDVLITSSPASAGADKTIGDAQSTPSLAARSGRIAYAALMTALEVVKGPTVMFQPLKITVGGILSILTIVDVSLLLVQMVTSEYSSIWCCDKNIYKTAMTFRTYA